MRLIVIWFCYLNPINQKNALIKFICMLKINLAQIKSSSRDPLIYRGEWTVTITTWKKVFITTAKKESQEKKICSSISLPRTAIIGFWKKLYQLKLNFPAVVLIMRVYKQFYRVSVLHIFKRPQSGLSSIVVLLISVTKRTDLVSIWKISNSGWHKFQVL